MVFRVIGLFLIGPILTMIQMFIVIAICDEIDHYWYTNVIKSRGMAALMQFILLCYGVLSIIVSLIFPFVMLCKWMD